MFEVRSKRASLLPSRNWTRGRRVGRQQIHSGVLVLLVGSRDLVGQWGASGRTERVVEVGHGGA